jgi:hypothetical protein
MISYSTNWMGPINTQWYEERGLTKMVTHTCESEMQRDILRKRYPGIEIGDSFEREEITTYYGAGRIDIYDVPGEHYPLEYGLEPMHGEDWNDFGDWLESFQTHELWEFDDIIKLYEDASGRKIRWASDTWYKCYECGLLTDLRETTEHLHKMDCTRKWDKK